MVSETPAPERLHDVVVVGGGLCGLMTATQLHRAGADVVVLEASSEVGGRIRSRALAGRTVDLGGELVGRDYVHLRRLVAALGLRVEPAGPVLPRVRLAPQARPPLRPSTATGLAAVATRLNHLCALLPAAGPWRAAQATRLDAVSLGHWLETAPVDAATARLLGAAAQAFSTAHPRKLSLLAFLTWLKPAGGVSALWRETRWRIAGGAQEVVRCLAARMASRVFHCNTVEAVEQDKAEVAVHTSGGTIWRARQVAVCTPLASTGRIAFAPDLPTVQRELLDQVASPAITKLVAAPAAGTRPRTLAAGDTVMPLAMSDSHHAIGFAYGPHSAAPTARLREHLLARLRLGETDLEGFTYLAWHEEPHINGGYPAFAPGQVTRHGPGLRTNHQHVHFAGADRSTWPGTMEGAVMDGIRVATRIRACLT